MNPTPPIDVHWEAREQPFDGGVRTVERAWVDGVPVYGVRGHPELPATQWTGREGEGARGWVWRDGALLPVRVVDRWVADPPATVRIWVDGHTGEILATTPTSRSALGDVWALNPVVSELARTELPDLVSDEWLAGSHVLARSCDDAELSLSLLQPSVCHGASSHALPDPAGDYLFTPDPVGPEDPLAEVQLYYQATTVVGWMSARWGLDLPTPIAAYANFPWANAFYGDFDGDGAPDVSFGEADGVDLGYDGDVVTHELGHAAVALLSPDLPLVTADSWGLEWAPGAVNEGAADVFAMLRSGDPRVGEYAGAAFGRDAIRDLWEVRRCPDDLSGEVHHDGEILGSFAWSLIERIGADPVGELLVGAIPLWGPGAGWATVGDSLRRTADELVAAGALSAEDHREVLGALDTSGMVGCARAIPLDDGRRVVLTLFNGGLTGDLARLPGAVALTLDVPVDADRVVVQVSGFEGAEGLGWTLYGRSGLPVEHLSTDLAGLGLGWSVPAIWDWSVSGTDSAAVVPLDAAALRGETLFLSVASDNTAGDLPPLVAAFGSIGVSAFVTERPPLGSHGCTTSAGWDSWAPVLAVWLGAACRRRPRYGRRVRRR